MRRHDDGGAARERFASSSLQHGDGPVVERRERLVEKQHFGLVQEGAGDGEALPHAARELARQAVFHVRESDVFERFGGGRFGVSRPCKLAEEQSGFRSRRDRHKRRCRGRDNRSGAASSLRQASEDQISPFDGFERPARIRSSVVFPAPLRPSSARHAPRAT